MQLLGRNRTRVIKQCILQLNCQRMRDVVGFDTDLPASDEILLPALHMMRLCLMEASPAIKKQSRTWLRDRGIEYNLLETVEMMDRLFSNITRAEQMQRQ